MKSKTYTLSNPEAKLKFPTVFRKCSNMFQLRQKENKKTALQQFNKC